MYILINLNYLKLKGILNFKLRLFLLIKNFIIS